MQALQQNISPIKQRILYFAGTLGISKRDFYSRIGVSRGTLESKTGITEDVLTKFFATYPEVNVEWIMSGIGDMIKTKRTPEVIMSDFEPFSKGKDNKKTTVNQSVGNIFIDTRPRIPFDAAAGTLSAAISPVSDNDCEQIPVIPTFPHYDFSIIARGDSMVPEFQSGDELACAFVKESSFVQWGRAHILDTTQGVILKKIFNREGTILCRSINPDYPDIEVPKEDIYHIAIVVGLIRHF